MLTLRAAPLLLAFLCLAFTNFATAGLVRRADKHANGKRPSIIFLVPDGYGIATHTMAREVDRIRKGDSTGYFHQLPLDKHNLGTIQTKSASSLVTDSAAGGTAFACGEATTNGFIGYENNTEICATVLEGAKTNGYYTGLVTTARVTHATPAVFSSHTYDRDDESAIAIQQLGGYILGRQVDLLWGGGRGFFLPQDNENSSRSDDRNLIQEAWDGGWQVMQTGEEFNSYSGQIPALGLFSRSHMAYEIDRPRTDQPSLIEMATKALNTLDSQDEPFFIMIESGRIDHAGHANDAGTIAREALHFNELWEAVKGWVNEKEGGAEDKHDYILLSSADHETGGLNLPSNWRPDWVLNSTVSVEELTSQVEDDIEGLSTEELTAYIRDEAFTNALGYEPTDEQVATVVDAIQNPDPEDEFAVSNLMAEQVSEGLGITWGSNDHSQVDVAIYLYTKKYDAKMAREFSGSHPNYWLGNWLAKKLHANLESIQQTLEQDGSLGNQTYLEELRQSGPVGT